MNAILRTMKTICTILVLAAFSLSAVVSCESYDDSAIQEAIKDLQNRVSALEEQVADNVEALQSMVSAGSIAKCEYDMEKGKVVITLLDGTVIDFDLDVTGSPLVTVVEKDGSYWWAICRDGETVLLEIDGKNVPVSVTPALKISADNEWLISVDGGNTWTHTGIFQNTSSEDAGVAFFKDVVLDGDFLYITLADGTQIKVAVVGDAEFSASETSLWFTRAEQEKTVVLTMKNVEAFTITEKPEGWKAQVNEEMLIITSPSDIASAEQAGTIKILSVFTNGAEPAILSVEVQYEPEFTLSADDFGTVKVNVSEHVDEGYAGYLIKAWKEEDFSLEAVTGWLNTEGYALTPATESGEFNVSELAGNYDSEASYVIFATSYIAQRLIVSGEASYAPEDIVTVSYTPSETNIVVSDISYDSAHVKALFVGYDGYYGGIASTSNWNNYVMADFLELLSYGGVVPLTSPMYDGAAECFPDGVKGVTILPSTEYTLWLLPVSANGRYTAADFILTTFTTSGISADASIAAPDYNVTEVTYGGFTAEVTPAPGAYKTYAAILSASVVPESDEELVNMLLSRNTFSEGNENLTVTTNSFNPDSEVCLVAVSMSKDGGYGAIRKEQVALKQLEYSDAVGISDCTPTYGVGDVTLTLTFFGEPSTITYSVATFSYYSDEQLQKMMAMSQFGDVQDAEISSLTNGNQICLTGLEIGAEYTLYALVKDAEGKPSYLFTKKFIPSISVDYIMSTDEGYSYGMPQISGYWPSSSSYNLTIDMPENCVKYWISLCDAEYLTGDPWTDTDKLITETLYKSEAHTESIKSRKFTYVYKEARLYMAWLDDKGEYHAIYEYNIHNDK